MASRKKPRKKKSSKKTKAVNDWYIGQILRLIIPEDDALRESGIPAILIETAMPEFLHHLDMFEYLGSKNVCGTSNDVFKRLNDWDQEFIISSGFFKYFEKRKANIRKKYAPF